MKSKAAILWEPHTKWSVEEIELDPPKAGEVLLELAASGGEDYELLAALPPERLPEAATRIGEAAEATLTQIGEVVDGEGVEIRLPGGGALAPTGFDQLG